MTALNQIQVQDITGTWQSDKYVNKHTGKSEDCITEHYTFRENGTYLYYKAVSPANAEPIEGAGTWKLEYIGDENNEPVLYLDDKVRMRIWSFKEGELAIDLGLAIKVYKPLLDS